MFTWQENACFCQGYSITIQMYIFDHIRWYSGSSEKPGSMYGVLPCIVFDRSSNVDVHILKNEFIKP